MKKGKPSWQAKLVSLLLKLAVVFVVVIIAAGIYFDAQIKQKFSGTKWQLPALVYGVEHRYYQADALTRADLIQHLSILDYRKVRRLSLPGEYTTVSRGVEFIRRAYSLQEDSYGAQRIRVIFNGKRIEKVLDVGLNKALSGFQLEPYLLDRLQANNLEDRILVDIQEVPKLLIQTLLLIEDRNFYQHHGVAPLAILRALWVNIQAGRTVQGGSTLTQQLVKNMFLTNERSLWRKIKEAYLAILLDARYSKSEILQAYINEVYVGQNHNRSVNGMGLASQYYFAKPLNELSAQEIALLVGMIKGPSYYNPRKYPERAIKRRDLVLRIMTEHALLTPKEYEAEVSRSLSVRDLSEIATRRFPSYVDQVREELKALVSNDTQLFSGLKIYTHFDPLAQSRAQASLSTGIEKIQQQRGLTQLQGATVVVDSKSGGIKALVGDKTAHYAGFNRALNAQRNIGSLIKPIVYLSALQQQSGYTLATILEDKKITLTSSLGNKWSPKNYDEKYVGDILLIDALAQSRNIPAVNLGMQTGLSAVVDNLHQFGIEREISAYPSLLLGSLTLSPLEVAQLYQVFANHGVYSKLKAIKSIYSNDDEIIWRPKVEALQVVDYEHAYLVNYALHQVTKRGTAASLQRAFPTAKFAGKTGTTNDGRDSWFVGYEQSELAVVWLGRDDNQAISLTGSAGALQVFKQYQHSRTGESLVIAQPAGVAMRYFNKQTGAHSLPGCDNLIMLPAIIDKLPTPIECERSEQWQKPKKSWLEKLLDW
ncbi:penicillin-binding protein 1B [Catenovulum sediminis]|uniref:Penicillin-binding protein 1B n=1 Tax=Catenovulum sediminis TaxID=1740262 RepID=A0ABV1RI65_9ALTE